MGLQVCNASSGWHCKLELERVTDRDEAASGKVKNELSTKKNYKKLKIDGPTHGFFFNTNLEDWPWAGAEIRWRKLRNGI